MTTYISGEAWLAKYGSPKVTPTPATVARNRAERILNEDLDAALAPMRTLRWTSGSS